VLRDRLVEREFGEVVEDRGGTVLDARDNLPDQRADCDRLERCPLAPGASFGGRT
jgi:hypothetical protein